MLCFVFNLFSSHVSVPGEYLEVCRSTSSYTAQYDDELSFEAGANIYIILQNGGGW